MLPSQATAWHPAGRAPKPTPSLGCASAARTEKRGFSLENDKDLPGASALRGKCSMLLHAGSPPRTGAAPDGGQGAERRGAVSLGSRCTQSTGPVFPSGLGVAVKPTGGRAEAYLNTPRPCCPCLLEGFAKLYLLL